MSRCSMNITGFLSSVVISSTLLLALVPAHSQAPRKPHLLVISIDGMRPDYITDADKHGLKIPTLRKFFATSVYADGVVGVLPTITYPSHTTMMTGVWPIEHGVYGNQKFNPFAEGKDQVTDISTIKVPTLWEVAHRAGYTVASVGWPVTTGAKFIDWLLPANAAFEGGDADGATAPSVTGNVHYDNPPGLREQLADVLPSEKLDVNATRLLWQLAVIKRFKPEFMTVHVGYLDHAEHTHGPFSAEANAALEMDDAQVGQLIEAERSVYADAYILIVSDHGFLPTEHAFSVNALFVREGLIDLQQKTWQAAAYNTGGTSAIIVRDPSDAKVVAHVKAVIEAAAKNPAYGIGRVLNNADVKAQGGREDALFMLDPAPGWRFATGLNRLVTETPGTGAHGQMPSHPELRAAFMLKGPGVPIHHDVGLIDMRQIAPTIAKILKIEFPSARMPAVPYTK